jgi:hypothetical protein
MSDIVVADRSLEQVTQGIRILTAQTAANMCQIGKLLTEAKAMVGHGGWKQYLETEVSYSQSTANNFMRMYEAYGEFGPNSQTFGNLGASKALELLALPEGQRERFAESHDLESTSVRELKAQIAAEKKKVQDAEISQQALREQLAVAQEEIGAAHQNAADWQKQAHDWQEKSTEDRRTERKLRTDIKALEIDLAAARAQAGKVPPEEMSRIWDEAFDAAQQVVADSHRAELSGKDDLIRELEARLAQAEEALDKSDAMREVKDLIKLEVQTLGESLNRLRGYWLKFKNNPEIGPVLHQVAVRQIEAIYKGFDIEPV